MRKQISRLAALALILGLLISAVLSLPAVAAEGDSSSSTSGLVLDKTVKITEDGKYEITLEAYATGSKVITTTTTETPTDIILVLDLSSSMKDKMKTYSYTAYSGNDTQNTKLYANRHNSGNSNLWYQLENDSYVSVSVSTNITYTQLSNINQLSNSNLYSQYANNLFVMIGNSYRQVTVTRSVRQNNYTYTYTYTDADGNTVSLASSNGASSYPFKDTTYMFYTPNSENESTVYTYTYTKDGETVTICTSIGNTTQVSDNTFYSRSESTSSTTRLSALQTAVNSFIDSVYAKAYDENGNGINHRIAIVGFNTNATAYTKSGNSLAFVNMNESGQNTTLKTTVSSLKTSTGTVPATGITMANNLFSSTTIAEGESRNRVVILFTDGYPSTSGSDNFTETLANNTISGTHTSKSTHGATVYTVAVLNDADPTADIGSNTTLTGNVLKVNKYLHYASSNYPNATSLTDGGLLNSNARPFSGGKSYYLTATDSASLTNIFQTIASEIESGGSSTTLTSSTVIKDIISPQFRLPEGATAENITLETYQCIGVDANGKYTWSKNDNAMGATVTLSSTDSSDETTTNNQVSVTGFDFANNWVGSTNNNGTISYRGHKLVIKFTVEVNDDFLGGNNVTTNTSAGVYEDSDATEPVDTFPQPKANVQIKNDNTKITSNVYLGGYYGQTLTGEDIKNKTEITIDGVTLDLSKEDYGLADWQKEYVDIEVSITDENGNKFSDIEKLTDDVEYTVTVTIKPKEAAKDTSVGTANETNGKASALTNTIHVFKPELTYKDSQVWYGDGAPTGYSGNLTQTRWVHYGADGTVDKVDTDSTMLGNEPTLDVTYTPEDGKIENAKIATKQDIPVAVTVKIGEWDVTQYVTFKHTKCENDNTCTDPTNGKFWLHVNTCQLTVTKTGGADNESYVFDVYKDGTKYTEVTIWGNVSETIYELPVGTYSISENTGWSWRYSANNGSTATLSAENSEGNITCTNTSTTDKWLNGFSTIVKNIYGVTRSN